MNNETNIDITYHMMATLLIFMSKKEISKYVQLIGKNVYDKL